MKLLLIPCLAALATSVHAQSGGGFSVDWSTIDTGGVMPVSGGAYVLGATVGQPDAAPTVGVGAVTLTGGFWSLFAPDCGGRLTLRVVGNQIQVSWPATETNCVLIGASTAIGLSTGVPVWDTANGSVYSQPLSSPRRFFRLRQR